MEGLKFSKHGNQGNQKKTLLQEAQELKKKNKNDHKQQDEDQFKIEEENQKKFEEQNFQAAIQGTLLQTLKEQKEKLKDKQILSSWQIPVQYREKSFKDIAKTREKSKIIVEGEEMVPPVTNFLHFNLPKQILKVLKNKFLQKPTPIQSQVLPLALMGRDIIGIAPSGQGKTLTFMLPALLKCLEEDMKLPLIRGEGPYVLILVPSHELAVQTYETAMDWSQALYKQGYSRLKVMLNIGGMNARDQMDAAREGVHIIIGTPGRISDNINKNKFNMDLCQYVVLDEADRLLDVIFEQDISNIFTKFENARQTLLFSSTMPKKVAEFAKSSLSKPVIVNIGRAGAVNLNVIQDVQYIKQEDKLLFLLECLQKTGPQVLIFCDKTNDVDDIQEYLMIKGLDVTSLHGQKMQEERAKSMKQFKSGEKDILVATDLAAKGLDFPNIKHVINYDMPPTIESYVHRIGRTARGSKTGRATTMVNKNQDTIILGDLKLLLIESKQKIPPFLRAVQVDQELLGGCGFCGGLGHRMADCAQMERQKMKAISQSIQTGTKEEFQKYTKDDYEFKEEELQGHQNRKNSNRKQSNDSHNIN